MTNPMQLRDRVVLVTGAAGGLGRATAGVLAELGARVVLSSRNEARLGKVLQELPGEGHRVSPFDLAAIDSVCGWMKSLAGDVGPLWGLVHSAGVHRLSPLRISTPKKVDELMRVNFAAAVELTRGFNQRSVRGDRGSVVYLSSIMGLVGQRGVSAYSASKGALIALARSLALELADQNVRVNCVCPGVVETPMATDSEASLTDEQATQLRNMHPLGVGAPADVAYAVAFLLSDASRWITGQALAVDGGYTAA